VLSPVGSKLGELWKIVNIPPEKVEHPTTTKKEHTLIYKLFRTIEEDLCAFLLPVQTHRWQGGLILRGIKPTRKACSNQLPLVQSCNFKNN
jgi:hypothetical protein